MKRVTRGLVWAGVLSVIGLVAPALPARPAVAAQSGPYAVAEGYCYDDSYGYFDQRLAIVEVDAYNLPASAQGVQPQNQPVPNAYWQYQYPGTTAPAQGDVQLEYQGGNLFSSTYGIGDNNIVDTDTIYVSYKTPSGSFATLPPMKVTVPAQSQCTTAAFSDASNPPGGVSAPVTSIVPRQDGAGYWLGGADSRVYSFGAANNSYAYAIHGEYPTVVVPNAPIVGVAATPDGLGYWLVGSDGGVFNYGHASYYGSEGGVHLNAPIVGIVATPDGGGYWLVASDGGIFNFGDAHFYGSMGGERLNQPVVGMAADPATGGYWLVASDGGVFTFNAPFHGSKGGEHLNQPVVGMASSDSATGGYWLVASDGGVFTFNTPFYGSTGSEKLNEPVVGMAVNSATGGYWLVARDGGIFNFNSPFYGSAA